MKRNLAIYASLISMFFLVTSCLKDNDEKVDERPFAAVTSFSLGNFNVLTKTVTKEGEDSTFYASVAGTRYPFVIDQITREIYNPDSLPFGTDNTRMKATISCDGVAYIFNDSINEFVAFSSEDTINYEQPKRILTCSFDGRSMIEYSLRVNVHKVDPENLDWQQLEAPEAVIPRRLVQMGDEMLLYAVDGTGRVVLYSQPLNGMQWSDAKEVATLPAAALDGSVLLFDGALWSVADGVLYSSADGVQWSSSSSANDFRALLLADSRLWVVADGAIMNGDGTSFAVVETLPEGFPVENISSAAYPLITNPSITRSVVVGYPEGGASPAVWSKLSNESGWSQYSTHLYSCPALKNLTVLRYDDKLYAMGGSGVYEGREYDALSEIFASNDNGLTWLTGRLTKGVKLPSEVAGVGEFAVAASSDNRIWIVAGGVLYRGGINRLINK